MQANPTHPSQAASRGRVFHIIFFILAFSAWIIAMAGLAQTQNADSRTGRDSVVFWSLWWWTIFYELILLILAVCLVAERPVRLLGYRKPVGDNFIIVTVLLSFMAYAFNQYSYDEENSNNSLARGYKCTAAGVVILLILNYIWIIVSGSGLTGPRALPTHTYAPGPAPPAQYQSPSPVSSPPKGVPMGPIDGELKHGSPAQPQVYVISDANPAANGVNRV